MKKLFYVILLLFTTSNYYARNEDVYEFNIIPNELHKNKMDDEFDIMYSIKSFSDDCSIAWKSSNPFVATIIDGTVYINGVGSATITGSINGHRDSVILEVTNPITDLIVPSNIEGKIGDIIDIDYQVIPFDTTDYDWLASFSSEDESIVKIIDDSKALLVGSGKTYIISKTSNNIIKKIKVEVEEKDEYLVDVNEIENATYKLSKNLVKPGEKVTLKINLSDMYEINFSKTNNGKGYISLTNNSTIPNDIYYDKSKNEVTFTMPKGNIYFNILATAKQSNKTIKTLGISIDRYYSYLKLNFNNTFYYTGYDLYRKTNDNDYVFVKTLSSDKNYYIDYNVSKNNNYTYKLRAYKIINNKKVYDNYVKSSNTSLKLLNRVKSLKGIYNNKSIKLSWNDYNMDGYLIYRKTNNSKYKLIKVTSNIYFVDRNISKNNKYTYKIKSYKYVDDEKVYSNYSNIVYINVK